MASGSVSQDGGQRIYRSLYTDVEVPDQPLHEFVLSGAVPGDKPALIDGPSGRTITFAQLADGVERAAGGLAARGFSPGDVLAIYSPNVPEYALVFYTVSRLGGVSTTVNPLYTVDELAAQLSDSGARWLVTVPPFADKAREAADRVGLREVFVLGEADGLTPFASLLATGATAPPVSIDPANDLATLPYSSGTTGLPKGVMLTHRNLVTNVLQQRIAFQTTPDDMVLAVLPFFHIYGLTVLMCSAVSLGATLVTMPRFDLEEFLRLHADHRITRGFLVPPIMLALARHPLVDSYDLSALKVIMSGAAPLAADVEEAVAKRLDCVANQGYGLTETSPVLTASMPSEDGTRHGSAGRLLPQTEMRVVDPGTGEDTDTGQPGELWFRGPQIMKGYLNRPEETAAMVTADGWLRTGDIGHVDDDGFVYVIDRVKELIKYKGMQVAPAELEALLNSHPAVTDSAVVRFPDEEAGEVPKAFVVRLGDLTEAELMAWAAERVAPHKRIRAVEFIEQVPRSASGKILRRLLVDADG
jgi:acyl-CoA synthetase (AMP-forming)/AMP-acid ligase II